MQGNYSNGYGSNTGGSSLNQIRTWAAQKQGVNPSLLASNQTLPYIPNSHDYNQYNSIDEAARRLEILTMQNRILKAQQESLMIRRQMEAVTHQHRSRIEAQQQVANHQHQAMMTSQHPQQLSEPPLHSRKPSMTPSISKEAYHRPPASVTQQQAEIKKQPDQGFSLSSSSSQQSVSQQAQSSQQGGEEEQQQQPVSQPISPSKPKPNTSILPPTHRKTLGDLSTDLSSTVEENASAIAKEKTQLLSNADRNKQKNRDERKRVVDSIAIQSTSRVVTIMPKWRHRALGNHNPPPEAIMKPKSHFRAVVYGIITAIIAPEQAVYHAKQQRKEKETRDFARSLRIFLESFSDWLSKPITLPITSIVEDGNMDFDIKDWIANKNKFIPFKVRFKAILQGLATATMPSATITNFLVSFLADDNYFPDDFFWSSEQALMQYNRLGGTRDVIPICETEDEVLALVGMTQKDVKQISLPEVESNVSSVRYAGVLRLRMLLIDVLFVRIVIAKLILSPWHYKVCHQPVNRNVRRAVNNLRLMATIFYQLARKLNPLLPATAASKQQQVSAGESANNAISSKAPLKLPAISTKKAADATSNKARDETAAPSNSDITATSETSKEDEESKGNKAAPPPKAPKGLVASLLKVVGLADTTPGFEDFKKGTLEFQLLNEPARYYDDTDFLFRFLLPDAVFVSPNLHAMLEDLLEESLPILREWFDKLMTHILQAIFAKRTKQQQQNMVGEPIAAAL